MLTDDELIKEVLDRAYKSDIFCLRMFKACQEFLKQLEEDSN